MNSISATKVVVCTGMLVFAITSRPLLSQESMVLDSTQHPPSPEAVSAYPGSMLPLDTRISWTQRFNGDETFNNEQMLVNAGSTDRATMTMGSSSSGDSGSMKMDGTGTIKSIRAEQGKVKLAHGAIEKYGMPGMTMVFMVSDPSMLDELEKGEEVGFNVDSTDSGFVITHIMSMDAMSAHMVSGNASSADGAMDATGTVKSIRAGDGKIKIEHGPIDKYGMPGMTMMFKVENPAQLEGLEKGSAVVFSVDNSSGGFVITHIKPAN